MSTFNIIVADPPWQYDDRGESKRGGTDSEYETCPLVDILNVWDNVPHAPSKNAILFLWITNGFLITGVGAAVCRAWGFNPKSLHTWNKVTKSGTTRIGVGRYGRNSTEHFIVAVRGSPNIKPFNSIPTTHNWQRPSKHSKKPDEFYELVSTSFKGRKLELYSRQVRDGWTVWGDEV